MKIVKAVDDINKRIFDLATALEYLIETSSIESTLQLRIKMIWLIQDNNRDATIFDTLGTAYSFRGKIVHGNDKVQPTAENHAIIRKSGEIIVFLVRKMLQLLLIYSKTLKMKH